MIYTNLWPLMVGLPLHQRLRYVISLLALKYNLLQVFSAYYMFSRQFKALTILTSCSVLSLFAECGGYLGMFLGISFLQLYSFSTQCWKIVKPWVYLNKWIIALMTLDHVFILLSWILIYHRAAQNLSPYDIYSMSLIK